MLTLEEALAPIGTKLNALLKQVTANLKQSKTRSGYRAGRQAMIDELQAYADKKNKRFDHEAAIMHFEVKNIKALPPMTYGPPEHDKRKNFRRQNNR